MTTNSKVKSAEAEKNAPESEEPVKRKSSQTMADIKLASLDDRLAILDSDLKRIDTQLEPLISLSKTTQDKVSKQLASLEAALESKINTAANKDDNTLQQLKNDLAFVKEKNKKQDQQQLLQFNELNSQIMQVKNQLSETAAFLSSIQINEEGLNNQVDQIKNHADAHLRIEERLDELLTDQTVDEGLQNTINDLQFNLDEIQKQVYITNSELSSIKQSDDSVDAAIEQLSNRLDQFIHHSNKNRSSKDTIIQQIKSMSERKLTEMEADIRVIKEQNNQLNEQVYPLELTLKELTNNDAYAQQQIKEQLSELKNTNNDQDLRQLEQFNTINDSIEQIHSYVNEKITEQASSIQNQEHQLTENDQKITNQLAENNTAITNQLTDNIEQLNKQTQLNTQQLKTDLANTIEAIADQIKQIDEFGQHSVQEQDQKNQQLEQQFQDSLNKTVAEIQAGLAQREQAEAELNQQIQGLDGKTTTQLLAIEEKAKLAAEQEQQSIQALNEQINQLLDLLATTDQANLESTKALLAENHETAKTRIAESHEALSNLQADLQEQLSGQIVDFHQQLDNKLKAAQSGLQLHTDTLVEIQEKANLAAEKEQQGIKYLNEQISQLQNLLTTTDAINLETTKELLDENHETTKALSLQVAAQEQLSGQIIAFHQQFDSNVKATENSLNLQSETLVGIQEKANLAADQEQQDIQDLKQQLNQLQESLTAADQENLETTKELLAANYETTKVHLNASHAELSNLQAKTQAQLSDKMVKFHQQFDINVKETTSSIQLHADTLAEIQEKATQLAEKEQQHIQVLNEQIDQLQDSLTAADQANLETTKALLTTNYDELSTQQTESQELLSGQILEFHQQLDGNIKQAEANLQTTFEQSLKQASAEQKAALEKGLKLSVDNDEKLSAQFASKNQQLDASIQKQAESNAKNFTEIANKIAQSNTEIQTQAESNATIFTEVANKIAQSDAAIQTQADSTANHFTEVANKIAQTEKTINDKIGGLAQEHNVALKAQENLQNEQTKAFGMLDQFGKEQNIVNSTLEKIQTRQEEFEQTILSKIEEMALSQQQSQQAAMKKMKRNMNDVIENNQDLLSQTRDQFSKRQDSLLEEIEIVTAQVKVASNMTEDELNKVNNRFDELNGSLSEEIRGVNVQFKESRKVTDNALGKLNNQFDELNNGLSETDKKINLLESFINNNRENDTNVQKHLNDQHEQLKLRLKEQDNIQQQQFKDLYDLLGHVQQQISETTTILTSSQQTTDEGLETKTSQLFSQQKKYHNQFTTNMMDVKHKMDTHADVISEMREKINHIETFIKQMYTTKVQQFIPRWDK